MTIDLTAARGTIAVEWMGPVEGTITSGETVTGGTKHDLKAPFSSAAVLYLKRTE